MTRIARLVQASLKDKRITKEEADAIAKKTSADGKISKAERSVLEGLVKGHSDAFQTGVRARFDALLGTSSPAALDSLAPIDAAGEPRLPTHPAVIAGREYGNAHLQQCPVVKAGGQLTIQYRREFADFFAAECNESRRSCRNQPLMLAQIDEQEARLNSSYPQVEKIVLHYQVDRGEEKTAVIADGSRDGRTGALLRREVSVDVPEDARGEVRFWFELQPPGGRGGRFTDAGVNSLGYRVTVAPTSPVPGYDFVDVDAEGATGAVQRLFPGTDNPEEEEIPARYFHKSANGLPIVFSDELGAPVSTPAGRTLTFIRGPEANVTLVNQFPKVTHEELASIGLTCFTIANEMQEDAARWLGRPLRWYNDAPLEIRPHAGSATYANELNAAALVDRVDADRDGVQNPLAVFRSLKDPVPGIGGWNIGATSRDPEIVAHEVGHQQLHGILFSKYGDFLADQALLQRTAETPFFAVSEAAADLGRLLHSLGQPEVVARALAQAGGDLARPNTMSRVGELYDFVERLSFAPTMAGVGAQATEELKREKILEPRYYDLFASAYAEGLKQHVAREMWAHPEYGNVVAEAAPAVLKTVFAHVGDELLRRGIEPAASTGLARVLAHWRALPPNKAYDFSFTLAETFRTEMLRVLGGSRDPAMVADLSQRVLRDDNWDRLKLRDLLDTGFFAVEKQLTVEDFWGGAEFAERKRTIGAERAAAWMKENYDERKVYGREGRIFGKVHQFDPAQKEPHAASLPLTSAVYEFMSGWVARRTARGEEPQAAIASWRDTFGPILFGWYDALPAPDQFAWGDVSYALASKAQQLAPEDFDLLQRALMTRHVPVCPTKIRGGSTYAVLHDPCHWLGIDPKEVARVELQYRVNGGPVQVGEYRRGQASIPVPSAPGGHLDYWFKVTTKDGRTSWDNNGDPRHNYALKILG